MSRTLVLGYGNFDRQDDGVAWHILTILASRLGYPLPITPEEGFQLTENPIELYFQIQITPELAELVAQYDFVCFIDSHTGNIPEEIHIERVEPVYQHSPLTHHMTPATLLSIAKSLYSCKTQAFSVSVRGYQYNFCQSLSEETYRLAIIAAQIIWNWLMTGQVPMNNRFGDNLPMH